MRGEAREEVLARIGQALAGEGATEGSSERPPEEPVGGGAEGRGAPSSTGYRSHGDHTPAQVLDLFQDRVSDYRATVTRVRHAELPAAVAEALARRGVERLVVPRDLPDAWLGSVPVGTVEVLRDGPDGPSLPPKTLASCHGVLTGCALGIAETGTFVLDSGPTQGRRAISLLPDYHLCVVFGSRIVETVPEAVRDLGSTVSAQRRPLTLVSGPSATSDIELVRVEGVHGPRTLDVILVEDEP